MLCVWVREKPWEDCLVSNNWTASKETTVAGLEFTLTLGATDKTTGTARFLSVPGVYWLHYLWNCFVLEVDDGFWEGELNGRIGVFPSLVVELLHDEGEEEEEEEVRPSFTPLTVWHELILLHWLTWSLLLYSCSLQPLPNRPSFFPQIPVPSNPGCSSARSATPPTGMEVKHQVFPPELDDNIKGEFIEFIRRVPHQINVVKALIVYPLLHQRLKAATTILQIFPALVWGQYVPTSDYIA